MNDFFEEIMADKYAQLKDHKNYLNYLNNNTIAWEPTTLSHGIPGIIIYLDAYQKYYSKYDKQLIHKYVQELGHHLSGGIVNYSLFGGIAGTGFAIDLISENGKYYKNFLNNIDELLDNAIEEMINKIHQKPLNPMDFDVISGLTGIGRYLLNRINIRKKNDENLKKIIKCFSEIHLSETQWEISNEYQFTSEDRIMFPAGNINLGLAHGILGPISLFALAYENGIKIKNHKKILMSMYEYIISEKFRSGLEWLDRYDLQEEIFSFGNIKNGWCYGNTSIMRTLFLIGRATNSENIIRYSKEIFYSIIKKGYGSLESTTFCHGLSSHLIIITLMNTYFNDEIAQSYTDDLFELIINNAHANSRILFNDINTKNGTQLIERKGGLLEGEMGVLVSLISYKNKEIFEEKNWTNAFLLS